GSSWVNQIALNQPMFGDITDEILQYIDKNESLMIDKNIKSISARRKGTIERLRRKDAKNKKLITNLQKKVCRNTEKINLLEKELDRIKNSRSWRYTRLLRKK